jgi:3-deoxy-D-manno-octulosonate 8-phosphate phosphatase (KDO 8-P phosphatase)
VVTLAPEVARARARRLALVISDVDGVLTDAGVYYSDQGEQLRRFSVRDGMGVARLREVGIETAFLTRELSGCIARRAEKLSLKHLWLGVHDKHAHLDVIIRETGLALDQLGYIGDDVNDLEILGVIAAHGLTAAPVDAMEAVAQVVHHRCRTPGGHGAFRDFAEWIISQKGVTR